MARNALTILILLLACGGTNAIGAQEATTPIEPQTRCWLAGLSFSSGSTIKAGNAVLECSPDYVWVVTDQWSAGCLHNGSLYSTGAIQNASQQQQMLTRCEPDGTWVLIEPSAD